MEEELSRLLVIIDFVAFPNTFGQISLYDTYLFRPRVGSHSFASFPNVLPNISLSNPISPLPRLLEFLDFVCFPNVFGQIYLYDTMVLLDFPLFWLIFYLC